MLVAQLSHYNNFQSMVCRTADNFYLRQELFKLLNATTRPAANAFFFNFHSACDKVSQNSLNNATENSSHKPHSLCNSRGNYHMTKLAQALVYFAADKKTFWGFQSYQSQELLAEEESIMQLQGWCDREHLFKQRWLQ